MTNNLLLSRFDVKGVPDTNGRWINLSYLITIIFGRSGDNNRGLLRQSTFAGVYKGARRIYAYNKNTHIIIVINHRHNPLPARGIYEGESNTPSPPKETLQNIIGNTVVQFISVCG